MSLGVNERSGLLEMNCSEINPNRRLPSTVGNISLSATNVILSSVLLGWAAANIENTAEMIINFICELPFVVDPSFDLANQPAGIPLLDVRSIKDKVDTFFASVSKAYIDGYDSASSALLKFTTVSVETGRRTTTGFCA
ncbi:hypothetical protein JAAARDRAFT_200998 [Jaapia argillacea MUCL 33604]|uniref:Uncharacterized protein n=1 Tax=Jaapia argillacea MUCL 33604 TaxID=933084 RepID=A0A067PE41_9AGAM|nr:hypothetical protein JAAARDRAFT_200998 [Jaapia argillacea MUCL 33604]